MRRKAIHIKWSKRISIWDYDKSKYKGENGVYMISRIWGKETGTERSEKILYIGKTIHSFESRLASHTAYWIPELRGSIFVRFGLIEESYDNDLLEDIESALICHEQPQENYAKTQSYTFRTEFLPCIYNEGFRGPISSYIDAADQLDPDSV